MVAAKTAAGQVTLTPGITTVTQAFLGRALGRVIRWEKFDRHGKAVRASTRPGRSSSRSAKCRASGRYPY